MVEPAGSSRELALAFIGNAFAGRTEEAIAMFGPDLEWQLMGPAGGLRISGRHNRAKAERILRALGTAVPQGFQYEVIGVTAEQERVAVEVEAEGTWIDGRIYRNAYHFLIRVRDEKIVEVKEYLDTLGVFLFEHPEFTP